MPDNVAEGIAGRLSRSDMPIDCLLPFLNLAAVDEYHGLAFFNRALLLAGAKTERNAQTDTMQTATHASTSSQKYSQL